MNKINYSKQTESIIEENKREHTMPSLLIHACCAPCSSACLEYLNPYFRITVFYYNPNISPEAEFEKRLAEEKRLLAGMPFENPVDIIEGHYDYGDFLQIAKGLEDCPEGGERCFRCYRLRLEETARLAKEKGFDYFCTTLSISPLKNAQKINEIGLGPAGLGGDITALAVNINTYATHIAGLPVAVNMCCHVNRHIVRTI